MNQEFLKKQIARMSGLDFSGVGGPEAARELIRVLDRTAKSEGHVTRIIDRVLDTETKFPAPSTLRQIANEVTEKELGSSPDGCSECASTGRRYVERMAFNAATKTKILTSAVEYCGCAKGRWLAQKAAERKALEGTA